MNIYERALQKIEQDQKYKPSYTIVNIKGATGPTGPSGENGKAMTILGSFDNEEALKETYPTGNVGDAYIVGDDLYVWSNLNNDWMNVGIIRGPQGPTGPIGSQGPQGLIGPQGERGKDGTSVTILGNYNTLDELKNNHPTGNPGNSYLVDSYLYVWSQETGQWINVGQIRGPEGPRGEQGPQGPRGQTGPQGPQGIPGSLEISTGFFITSIQDIPDSGLKIESGDRLPIGVKTFDNEKIFYASNVNNTITFLKEGIYRIDFIVQAQTNSQENSEADSNIISIGFKQIEDDTIYAANSVWCSKDTPSSIVGHGIVNLTYPKQLFELVNLGKYPIFLKSPKIKSLNTKSSLASTIVTVIIQSIS